jgi:four helix bundle protein
LIEIPTNKLQIPSGRMAKVYDLEERTEQFAKDCRILVRTIPKDLPNIEDCKQLVKASGSVAANYIEANEALSKKDFCFRIKICRKEAKESRLWLNLLQISELELDQVRKDLAIESGELIRIFTSIISKNPPST